MKNTKEILLWLENEICLYEMKQEEQKPISKIDETKYIMAQELLAWIIGYTFDIKRAVIRVPRDLTQKYKHLCTLKKIN